MVLKMKKTENYEELINQIDVITEKHINAIKHLKILRVHYSKKLRRIKYKQEIMSKYSPRNKQKG